MEVHEQYDISPYTTFQVPATARYFARAQTRADLVTIRTDRRFQHLPHLILGGGSNILFAEPFPGLVMHPAIRGISITGEDDTHVYVTAGAGEKWDDLVSFALARNLGGVENLIRIPGSVGAAPIQNIGAYGVELQDVFHSLRAFSLAENRIVSFDRQACDFGYRSSIFKTTHAGKYIVTDVTLALAKTPVLNTEYTSLTAYFSQAGRTPVSISEVAEAVATIRDSKLPHPDTYGNAGSFFTSPIVSAEKYQAIRKHYPDVPAFDTGEGYKIPAGWCIEQVGYKGVRRGAVGVHEDHALVLVNYGGGTAEDLLALARDIHRDVCEQFAISLTPEVRITPDTAWQRQVWYDEKCLENKSHT